MASIQQEKYMQGILEHDFDTWYETAWDSLKRSEEKDIIYSLNCIDAILAMQEDLGFDLCGGYYDMTELDNLINNCPANVLFQSNISDRYSIDDFED